MSFTLIKTAPLSPNTAEDLEFKMEIGVVLFYYLYATGESKKNKKRIGTLRKAMGTRNLSMSFIPTEDIPLGVTTPSPDVVTYWDIDRGAWRSCRRDRIVFVSNEIAIEE